MSSVQITIPEDIAFSAKIPKNKFEREIKKELALQLYREGILSFANARRLSGLSKVEFHFLLGERKIDRQYDIEDYEKDLVNLSKWSQQ